MLYKYLETEDSFLSFRIKKRIFLKYLIKYPNFIQNKRNDIKSLLTLPFSHFHTAYYLSKFIILALRLIIMFYYFHQEFVLHSVHI